MAQMFKANLALPDYMLRALTVIEQETDLPRTKIIRRAINQYLVRYSETNPEFAAKVGPLELEKEFKPGIPTDVAIIGGKKQTVVVTAEGWRLPNADDYVESSTNLLSILDKSDD